MAAYNNMIHTLTYISMGKVDFFKEINFNYVKGLLHESVEFTSAIVTRSSLYFKVFLCVGPSMMTPRHLTSSIISCPQLFYLW